MSLSSAERIRGFRDERLRKIADGKTPVKLYEAPKIVLHIIPFGAFDHPVATFDLSSLDSKPDRLKPIYIDIGGHRYNSDGFLTYCRRPELDSYYSYVQIFCNGSIEAVDAFILSFKKTIPTPFEKGLLDALQRYLRIQKPLGVEPPLFIMLSLLGVSGYTMAYHPHDNSLPTQAIHPIDRDNLSVPEAVIESFDCDPVEVMKPVFDVVWNAAGWPRSMNYDESGK